MNQTTKYLAVFGMMFIVLLAGCSSSDSADDKMAEKTEQAMNEANKQIGMPAIKNYQERKLAKMIFELRDQEDLVCYAYVVARNTGRLVFVGKCIGYGLPYSVQFTNPLKVIKNNSAGFGAVPQADPNGLFMPSGLSATWLMMIDSDGDARPVYFEPEIVVSPFLLQ